MRVKTRQLVKNFGNIHPVNPKLTTEYDTIIMKSWKISYAFVWRYYGHFYQLPVSKKWKQFRVQWGVRVEESSDLRPSPGSLNPPPPRNFTDLPPSHLPEFLLLDCPASRTPLCETQLFHDWKANYRCNVKFVRPYKVCIAQTQDPWQ